MSNKKLFDIIFSTNHFRKGRIDVQKLLHNQEIRDLKQEKLILNAISKFRNDLMKEVSADKNLKVTFGFNITSSLNLILSALPGNIITSTSEYFPVIKMIEKTSRKISGYIDRATMSNLKIIDLEISQKKKEILLLITHVAYSDGYNVLDSILNDQDVLAYLSNYRIHVVIDGAHAIGNNCMISDIEKIKQTISNKIKLESFTYIFDCYKWLQGTWGMSIIVSDSIKVIQTHNFIFPNDKAVYHRTGNIFSEPIPSSFNPSLIFWFLNADIVTKKMKMLKRIMSRNYVLTYSFIAAFKAAKFKKISILDRKKDFHNNIISLQVKNPVDLHSYLRKNGVIAHLISSRKVKIKASSLHFPANVRLCFSSELIKTDDVGILIKLLQKYDK